MHKATGRSIREGFTDYFTFKALGPKEFTAQRGGYALYLRHLMDQGESIPGKAPYWQETLLAETLVEKMGDSAFQAYFQGDEDAIQIMQFLALTDGDAILRPASHSDALEAKWQPSGKILGGHQVLRVGPDGKLIDVTPTTAASAQLPRPSTHVPPPSTHVPPPSTHVPPTPSHVPPAPSRVPPVAAPTPPRVPPVAASTPPQVPPAPPRVSPVAAPTPQPPAPATPLVARPNADMIYPIQLWPDVLASINRGGLGSTGSYVYVVPVARSDFAGPLSITPGRLHAIGRAAPDGDQVVWEAGRATQVVSPKTVYDQFGAPPKDHGWGFVLSQYSPDQIRQAGGLTNLAWQANKADIPGYPRGPAYERPATGLNAPFSDKTRGPRPFAALEAALAARQAWRGLGRNVFLPELGWVTRQEANAFRDGMTDRRYTSMHAADLVGRAPIPPQDDALGLNVADAHYHPNTFPHPRYLKMSNFMQRLEGGKARGLISDADTKIILTFENIPYQTQALAGNWLGYTAFDANRITTRYAFLDDWKVLAQWERLGLDKDSKGTNWRDRAIPSITGMEMYRVGNVSEYGSKMGAEQYLAETLLWFSDAYPITGENTVRNKEVWSLLLGNEKPHMGLIPGQYGAETPRDYATIEQAMNVVRDAGLVFVGHHDAGTTEIAVDGRPFAAPSDTRDFFALTNVLMRLGAYDLGHINFADANFRLSDGEVANIISAGPVRRPLRYIGAHGLGIKLNDSNIVAQMELMQWTFAHPLLRHVNADSSWLPVIERLMQNRQNIGPMADLIQTGRIFYGSDVLNIQNFEQWAAPWYAQQRLLRELQRRDQQALNIYASEGFLKLYEESKPDIDWFRYRQARAAGLGTDARVTNPKLAEFIAEMMPPPRRQKLEDWVSRYEQTHRSELFDPSGAFDQAHYGALVSKDSMPGLHARGAAVSPAVFHAPPSTPTLPRTSLRNMELATSLYEQIELGRPPARPIAEITGHANSELMTLPPGAAARPAQPAPTPPAAPPVAADVDTWLQGDAFTADELANLRKPDGTLYHPEAVRAAGEAAGSNAPKGLQALTLVMTDIVASRQDAVRDYLVANSDRRLRKIVRDLALIIPLAAGGGIAAMNGGFISPIANAGALSERGFGMLSRIGSLQQHRKISDGASEEGIADPKMLQLILDHASRYGEQIGLDPSRFKGDGSVEDVILQRFVDLAHLINTPMDKAAGETQETRHAAIQSMLSQMMGEVDRAAGGSWTGLEGTNFRTTPGRALALTTAVAYEVGALYMAQDFMANPAHLHSLAIGIANTAFALYHFGGAISGRHGINLAEHPVVRKVMNIGVLPTLTAGTLASSPVALFANGAVWESIFLGVAGYGLARMTQAAWHAERPTKPGQKPIDADIDPRKQPGSPGGGCPGSFPRRRSGPPQVSLDLPQPSSSDSSWLMTTAKPLRTNLITRPRRSALRKAS